MDQGSQIDVENRDYHHLSHSERWWEADLSTVGPSKHYLAFHGNASNIANRTPVYEFLRSTHANVFALEYRGYGYSEGKPSEAGVCWWLGEG